MNTSKFSLTLAAALLFALGTFTGCESTDSGSAQVSSNVYYGVGFYDDVWYHGDYDDDHNVIATPPSPGSPGSPPVTRPPDAGLRPSQPIARPPDQGARPSQPMARPPSASTRPAGASPRPAARPMPSIPSTPRPAPRGGGGRAR